MSSGASASAGGIITVGLIGGSGLLKTSLAALHGLTEEFVETAYGRVFLRTGTIAEGVRLVFVQRHDASPKRTYVQPSDINYQAIALALQKKARRHPRRALHYTASSA